MRFTDPRVIGDRFTSSFFRFDDDTENIVSATFLDESGNVIEVANEDAFGLRSFCIRLSEDDRVRWL